MTVIAGELPTASPAQRARPNRPKWVFALALALVLVVAAALRALPLTTGLPYTSYVDEGHVLHRSARMIAEGTWDPGWYNYPSLVINATTVSAGTYELLADGDRVTSGARTTEESPYYDVIEPPELVLAGRLVVFALAVGTVLLIGLLGARLAGRRAGVLAAMLAAVLPALVSRSATVIVDSPATFFATASLLCAWYVGFARRAIVWATAAGAAAGLAFASKYTAATSIAIVLVVIGLARERSVRERVRFGACAVVAAGVAAVLVMPALLVHPRGVASDLRWQLRYYGDKLSSSYWDELLRIREVGLLVVLIAAAGLVVLVRSVRSRSLTLGYLVFATATVAVLARSSYQPFRNVLPLLPFLCVAAAAAIVALSDAAGRRLDLGRRERIGLSVVITVLVCAALTGWGLRPYLDEQRDLVDSRVEARRWLQSGVGEGDDVLVAEELAFLPRELRRIPGNVVVRRSTAPAEPATTDDFDFIVVGSGRRETAWEPLLERRALVRAYGGRPTSPRPRFWRTNNQIVRIYGSS